MTSGRHGTSARILEQLATIVIGDQERTMELRFRHLALIVEALEAPGARPLPGFAPTWEELSRRWQARVSG